MMKSSDKTEQSQDIRRMQTELRDGLRWFVSVATALEPNLSPESLLCLRDSLKHYRRYVETLDKQHFGLAETSLRDAVALELPKTASPIDHWNRAPNA